MQADTEPSLNDGSTRKQERRLFIFIVVFLFPILSVMVVGGFGFIIWMYQLIAGPPGPPGH